MNVKQVCLLYVGLCTIVCHAQNDMSRVAFGVKGFTGGVGYMGGYTYDSKYSMQPNLHAPMPLVGTAVSFVCNTTEIELGATYTTKFWDQDISSQPGYKKIMYGEHYMNLQAGVHQKIFQVKKHVFSIGAAAGFQFFIANPIDTVHTDGTISHNWQPTNGAARRRYTINAEVSIRYTYVFSNALGIFIAPYFMYNFQDAYGYIYYGHMFDYPPTYIPIQERFSFGIKAGIHFMVHFVKDSPARFFQQWERKAKN